MRTKTKLLILLIFYFNLSSVCGQDHTNQSLIYSAKTIRILSDSVSRNYGTGTIIGKNGDTIFAITASHVVKNDSGISVLSDFGSAVNGEVIARDESKDIAAIKFSLNEITDKEKYEKSTLVAPLATSRTRLIACDVGDSLVVGGYPLGRNTPRFIESTLINLSYLGKAFGAEIGGDRISSGMSGGLVFNSNDEWIGMVSELRSQEGGKIALMVKYGAINQFIQENKVPNNLLFENQIVGEWKLTSASKRNELMMDVNVDSKLTLSNDARAGGLLNEGFCLRNDDEMLFGEPGPDLSIQSIPIPTQNGQFFSPFKLSDADRCNAFVVGSYNFQTGEAGSVLTLKCYSRFGDITNLSFTNI